MGHSATGGGDRDQGHSQPPPHPLSRRRTARPAHRDSWRRPVYWEHFPSVAGTQDKECSNLLERRAPPSSWSSHIHLKPRRRDKGAAFGLGDPGQLMPGDVTVQGFRGTLKRTVLLDSQGHVGRGRESQPWRDFYASKIVQILSGCSVGWGGSCSDLCVARKGVGGGSRGQ